MANITVTKIGTNGVFIDFGEYAGANVNGREIKSPQSFSSLLIEHIIPRGDGVEIIVGGVDGEHWYLSHTDTPDSGNKSFMIVDSINSQAPEDRNDLINKLTSLM